MIIYLRNASLLVHNYYEPHQNFNMYKKTCELILLIHKKTNQTTQNI